MNADGNKGAFGQAFAVAEFRALWAAIAVVRTGTQLGRVALAVLAYAVVLTVGVVRLAQGEAAWNGWLGALRTPASLLLHLVLLLAMLIHAKSWFEIMPKTMPPLIVGGRRIAASTITRAGWAAAVLASLVLFAFAWAWRS